MLKLTKLGLHYRIGKNKSLSKENVLAIMITTITLMIQMKTRYV